MRTCPGLATVSWLDIRPGQLCSRARLDEGAVYAISGAPDTIQSAPTSCIRRTCPRFPSTVTQSALFFSLLATLAHATSRVPSRRHHSNSAFLLPSRRGWQCNMPDTCVSTPNFTEHAKRCFIRIHVRPRPGCTEADGVLGRATSFLSSSATTSTLAPSCCSVLVR